MLFLLNELVGPMVGSTGPSLCACFLNEFINRVTFLIPSRDSRGNDEAWNRRIVMGLTRNAHVIQLIVERNRLKMSPSEMGIC